MPEPETIRIHIKEKTMIRTSEHETDSTDSKTATEIVAQIPMPSWKELMSEKHIMSETEKVVVNCIATISSHQNYQNMVPSEIYDQMVSTRLTLPLKEVEDSEFYPCGHQKEASGIEQHNCGE